jgi:hypothetical protein
VFARRGRRLLLVLAALAGVTALTVAISSGVERLRFAKEKAVQFEAQMARLQQSLRSQIEIAAVQERLKGRLESERRHFYAPREIDPYSFGTLVRKKLTFQGIEVTRYQVVELKGRCSLEFAVSGSIRSLILFLKEVSESQKYWSISSLTIVMREGTGTIKAVFRIGYEETDS